MGLDSVLEYGLKLNSWNKSRPFKARFFRTLRLADRWRRRNFCIRLLPGAVDPAFARVFGRVDWQFDCHGALSSVFYRSCSPGSVVSLATHLAASCRLPTWHRLRAATSQAELPVVVWTGCLAGGDCRVSQAKVDFDKRQATVTFDDAKTNVQALTLATKNVGYPSMLITTTR